MAERTEAEMQEMADVINRIVAGIEGGSMLTQGHYGAYMAIISGAAKDDHASARNLAILLMQAGANKQGVASALRIIVGG